MRFFYIDESGDTGTIPAAHSPVQPVLVIAGIMLDHRQLSSITHNFINLKQKFSPGLLPSAHRLSIILNEMKGTDIRRDVASGKKRLSRRAITFLDRFIEMLEYHKAKIFGRIWIKRLGYAMDGRAVFTSSTQAICHTFQQFLEQAKDTGLVIADSRAPALNMSVAHAIFTQKYKLAGDSYPRILEMPTFGHSNNHVGLQLADLLVSALLYPIACHVYCTGLITNPIHVKPQFNILRDRYGKRLMAMQFRYRYNDRWKGGITVSDDLSGRPGRILFGDPPPAVSFSPVIAPVAGLTAISSTGTPTDPTILGTPPQQIP